MYGIGLTYLCVCVVDFIMTRQENANPPLGTNSDRMAQADVLIQSFWKLLTDIQIEDTERRLKREDNYDEKACKKMPWPENDVHKNVGQIRSISVPCV